MHPGRTLVFCNSIDCVRRLRNVLELLDCHPLPLHASMHQRQRLKNLENFEKSQNAILLATDVAARGLDIRGIEHVIHFQVPRTAETYVHRSGRTARAENEGLSLLLIDPQDGVLYKKISKTLNKEHALPSFPVDHKVFKLVKERVTMARSIDKLEHRQNRLTAQNRWFQNAAKDMDVDIEDDLLNDVGDEQERAAKSREINAMKKQLKAMLSKPIISKIFTGSFPTKSGKLLSPSIYNPQKAVTVVQKNRKKKKNKL
ncbi:ATP-dependent RNA helicase DDX24 [Caerostris extrusa]|uniref:ATP-dependent RNA helicase DDX24 n=1 Tax=Caerostris extrusa TaxID=172846 RepID=A0AAV4PBC0_CAEEX|nr:ATP-dependent RNA helicase DDX24 [Caerostris extrusa]